MTKALARGLSIISLVAGGCRSPAPAGSAGPTGGRPATLVPSTSAAPARSANRCDARSCDYRTETCCESEAERMTGCVKKTLKPPSGETTHKCYGPRPQDWIAIECLTSGDCPSGERCCAFETTEGLPINHCASGGCAYHEACVPSTPATCPSGMHCEAVAATRSGGVCSVDKPRAACDKHECSGATRGCCYDLETHSGQCVAVRPETLSPDDRVCPLNGKKFLLECGSPADCGGGELCCTAGAFPRSYCSGACTTGGTVCRSLKDCPPFTGPAKSCSPDPELPAFIRLCQY